MRCVLCHSSCAQTPVLTYGRIIAESMDGRLNAASVMLEGDDSLSHGYRVKLGALRDAFFQNCVHNKNLCGSVFHLNSCVCCLFFRLAADLSEIESFAIFPGQIVVIEGNNATGQVLVAKKIYTNARLPAATTNEANMENFQVGNSHICTFLSYCTWYFSSR